MKKIISLFEKMSLLYGRFRIWSDFITLSAISFSNVFDSKHREERTKMYNRIAKQYTEEDMDSFSSMLNEFIWEMENNPDQDFLGNLYMTLNLGNEHAGQFFTPYSVSRLMVNLSNEDIKEKINAKGFICVSDPACGAGGMFAAFANECLKQGVNYQTDVLFVGQDIDFTVAMMCYLQLSVFGCPGYVKVGDTLADPLTTYDSEGLFPVDNGDIWYTPMYFRDEWNTRRSLSREVLAQKGE